MRAGRLDIAPEVDVSHERGGWGESGRSRAWRAWIFSGVFLSCALVGLIWDFSRPAVYQASAFLLIVPPRDVDEAAPAETDLQHTAVQRQFLLRSEVLRRTLERAVEEGVIGRDSGYSVAHLRSMFAVVPEKGTQVVELRAEDGRPERAAGLVNAWAVVYQDLRTALAAQALRDTIDTLETEVGELAREVEDKREELARFREKNEILSLGRDENEVLARLKGLTDSLNAAREEEVKARARVMAVRKAIEQGKPVLPPRDQAVLASLEARAQELREQLAELDQRYTREFLALEPSLRVIPEQLAALEKKIREMKEYGQRAVLSEAEQNHAAARRAVRELQAQLESHKHKAMEFTNRFAHHEALQEDLVHLEELFRTLQERLVRLQVRDEEHRPPVTILEFAQQPTRPVRPAYARDAAYVLAVAVMLGLFAVWLLDFLAGRGKHGETPPLAVRVWSESGRTLKGTETGAIVLPAQATPALGWEGVRELGDGELAAMLKAADSPGRQILFLLLSGLSVEEVAALAPEDVDLEQGRIDVQGVAARSVELPASVLDLLRKTGSVPAWEIPLEPMELDSRMALLAVDAGVSFPEQVNAQSIRHSYIAFLVRQGVRLSELRYVVGELPAAMLAAYGRFSPPGAGRPLEEIDLVHPAVAAMTRE